MELEKPEQCLQFQYPLFATGEFVVWHSIKVKIMSLRWDVLHSEFQYLICAGPIRANSVWTSERSLKK